jgi:hypothetical protein
LQNITQKLERFKITMFNLSSTNFLAFIIVV